MTTTRDSYNVENELIQQKNRIIALINHERYNEALIVLEILTPLWHKVGYGYKVAELAERIEKGQCQRKVKRTTIVRRNGQYVVLAYDQNNQRYADADYYTNDKDDATTTASAMVDR